MPLKKVKWPYVLLFFSVFIVSFLGIKQWWYQHFVEIPFNESLAALPGVEEAVIENKDHTKEIIVTAEQVKDLAVFYHDLEKIVRSYYGDDFRLVLKDNPNEITRDAYADIHFALHESIVQGNFVFLKNHVRDTLAGHGLDSYKLTVSEDNVYIQIHQGSSFLYRIISRNLPVKGDETLS